MAMPAWSEPPGDGHTASDGLRFIVHIPETVALKITPATDTRLNHSEIAPSGLPSISPSGYPSVTIEALGHLHAGRTVSLTAEQRHIRPGESTLRRPGASVMTAPRGDRATITRTTADASPLSFSYRRNHPISPVFDAPVVYTLSAP
jgi:hypothetical protein